MPSIGMGWFTTNQTTIVNQSLAIYLSIYLCIFVSFNLCAHLSTKKSETTYYTQCFSSTACSLAMKTKNNLCRLVPKIVQKCIFPEVARRLSPGDGVVGKHMGIKPWYPCRSPKQNDGKWMCIPLQIWYL